MRVFVYRNKLVGVIAQLLELDIQTVGKNYDDALYNLQELMAAHTVACEDQGVEHVWTGKPVDAGVFEEWKAGVPELHAEYVFRKNGKRIEIPSLDVRIKL